MGRFAELLVERWGGKLKEHNNYGRSVNEAKEESSINKEETLKELQLLRGRKILTSLMSTAIYYPEELADLTDDKIKSGFERLGFSEDVQNIIVEEFSSFRNNHKK